MRLLRITPRASDVSLSLLKHADASSDWFPPLKNTAGGALRIAQLVKGFRSHKKDWGNFGDHVQSAVACLVRLLPNISLPQEDLKQGIVKLCDSLQLIETRLGDPTCKRSYTYIEAQKAIQEMRTKIDDALCVLILGSGGLDVAKLLEGLDIKKHMELVHAKLGDETVTGIKRSNNIRTSQRRGDVPIDTPFEASRNPALTSLAGRQGASFNTRDAFTVHNVNGNQYIVNEYHGGGKPDVTSKVRESLSRVPNAGFDRSKRCLNATRKEIIDAIILWATSPNTPAAFWLSGLAGMGKTTIANSAAFCLKELGYLDGNFFFSRAVEARNKADQLFTTIAFQICSDPGFAAEIAVVLSQDPDVGRSGSPLLTQYEELIERPLKATGRDSGKPLVIVLDALDECGTERDRTSLLDVIARQSGISTRVKFFITSRPESDISRVLSSSSLAQRLDLSATRSDNVYPDRDIATFFLDRMSVIAELHRLSVAEGDQWPGRERIGRFVRKASGLFIWASTACEFIHDDDGNSPDTRLDLVLGDGSPDTSGNEQQWLALDTLYLQVLQAAARGHNSDKIAAQILEILGVIVIALNPLSSSSLSSILEVESPNVIWQRLRKLQSVLTVPEDDSDLVRTIHLSFPDFLTDADRCTDSRFYVKPSVYHALIAKKCLLHMQIPGKLGRDICRLGYAPRLNSTIEEQHINHCIPADLRYACEFWAEHIHRSSGDINELRSFVEEFLFEHLLHWLEVLSLLGKFGSAVALLRKVNEWWIQTADVGGSVEAQVLLNDALLFAREFHIPIAASASQIYISALPFSPQSSAIFRRFSDRYNCKATVVSGAWPHWPSNISIGCEEAMRNLAFSPDGNRVVCSSWTVIYVYDLSVGGRVGLPLIGHTDNITSVAFAANDRHVLSSSYDGSVRLWDTRTNSQVDVVHHEGHKILQAVLARDGSTVHCISCCDSAVSQDSFASEDSEASDMEYYDLFMMSIALAPGGGHFFHPSRATKQLCQILSDYDEDEDEDEDWDWYEDEEKPYPRATFSVCGDYTAINREDRIQVWDTKTAAVISESLQMPEHVRFVSFSPSSNWILAIAGGNGEAEHITKVWDWRSGSIVYEFSTAYPTLYDLVVAFSPEGNNIFLASSPDSCDIRAWKFSEGCLMGEPWKGSASILAIAFSPDGSLLVSAANDKSLSVWDTSTTAVPEQQSLPERATDIPSIESSIVDQPLCQTFRQPPLDMVLSPDGTQLVTVTETSESTYILRVAPWSRPNNTVDISACWPANIAFSPDGSHIVFQPSDESIGIWNSVTGNSITHDLRSTPTKVLFSPDGKRLFGYSYEQGWTWDFENDIFSDFSDEQQSLHAMSVSRNGHILATGNSQGDVCLRNPQTGIRTGRPLKGHTGVVFSVAFSPDGTRLASGSSDNTVRVWDVEKRISVGPPLRGRHTSSVNSMSYLYVISVSYSPDGEWIIYEDYPNERLVWDAHDLSPANLSTVDAQSRRFVPGASFLHLDADGWLVDLGDNPILWVPADTRKKWMAKRNSLALAGLGGTRLVDLSDIALLLDSSFVE